MRLQLTVVQRGALGALSVTLYAASLLSLATGIQAQGDGSTATRELASVVVAPTPEVLGQLAIERDPFASGDVALSDNGGVASPAFDVPDVREISESDFAATGGAPSARPAYTLKATITGGNSVAYVQDGNDVQIVRVGDVLAGKVVVRIRLDGIDFADGMRLLLSNSRSPQAPARRQRRVDVAQELEALRKLLSLERRRSIAPVPAASVQDRAAPTAPATFPPPGPLPTIVPDFLPVGVSPTSDPNGPTPYPLPPPRPNF